MDTKYIISAIPGVLKKKLFSGDRQDDMALELTHPERVFCGCTFTGADTGIKYYFSTYKETYDTSWETTTDPEVLRFHPKDTTCRILLLRKGESVVNVVVWLNRRMGITGTQHWRRECWEKMFPIFQEESNQKRLNEMAAAMAKPPKSHRMGRPISEAVAALSPVDAVKRTKLINLWGATKQRNKIISAEMLLTADAARIVKLAGQLSRNSDKLISIYHQAEALGAAPEKWAKELGIIIESRKLKSNHQFLSNDLVKPGADGLTHFLTARQLGQGYDTDMMDRDDAQDQYEGGDSAEHDEQTWTTARDAYVAENAEKL